MPFEAGREEPRSRAAGRCATTRATSRRSSAPRSRARAAPARRTPSASRCGSRRRPRRPAGMPSSLADRRPRRARAARRVEVTRARDVALPRVARLAAACRRTRPPCGRRRPRPRRAGADSSSSSISLTARRTTPSSAANAGRSRELGEPLARAARAARRRAVAGADHPRREGDVGEEAQPDRERLEPLGEPRSARRGGTRSSRRRAGRRSGRPRAARARGPRRRPAAAAARGSAPRGTP